MRQLKIIEVNSELGGGTRGASLGIEALKIAAFKASNPYFQRYESIRLPNENQLLLEPLENQYAKRIAGVYTMIERVGKELSQTLKQHKFPLVLSGDHSISAGTVSGIKKAFPASSIGVIWIDAHADIHSPYTTPSGNLHGMPLAILLNEDNLEHRINHPNSEIIDYWNRLKTLFHLVPKITYPDLVYIGMRDLEPQEASLLQKHQVKTFSVEAVRRRGAEAVVAEVLQSLTHCDLIYLSFDVDVMDPSVSSGTGTPVPNGLTAEEAADLLSGLVSADKTCCLEIVEINPTLDTHNRMAETTFKLLHHLTPSLLNKILLFS